MSHYSKHQTDNKLCILQIGPVPPAYGGVSSFIHNTSRYLVKRGHNVIVTTLSFKPRKKDEEFDFGRNYKVIYFKVFPFLFLKAWWRFIELMITARLNTSSWEVFKEGLIKILRSKSGVKKKIGSLCRLSLIYDLCKTYEVDAIIGHHGDEKGLFAIIVGSVLGIRGYPFLHGGAIFYDDRTPGPVKEVVKTVIKFAEKCLFCSSNSINRARELGMPVQKAIHVGEGVDVESIECRPIPPMSPFHVMTIGYLSPHRGLEELIQAIALAALKIPNLKLSIIGDDPYNYWNNLKNLVSKLNLYDSVKYLGEISQRSYLSLLKNTHVAAFLLRGPKTGSLASCLEVQAAGIPVLTTGKGGLYEYVKDGETGIICKSSPQEVAAALVRIYKGYLQGKWQPEVIRSWVVNHSWERVARNIESAFLRVLE